MNNGQSVRWSISIWYVSSTQPIQLLKALVVRPKTIQWQKGCKHIHKYKWNECWNESCVMGWETTEPCHFKLFLFYISTIFFWGPRLAFSFATDFYSSQFIYSHSLHNALWHKWRKWSRWKVRKGDGPSQVVASPSTNSIPNWIQRGQTMYLHLLCFVYCVKQHKYTCG